MGSTNVNNAIVNRTADLANFPFHSEVIEDLYLDLLSFLARPFTRTGLTYVKRRPYRNTANVMLFKIKAAEVRCVCDKLFLFIF